MLEHLQGHEGWGPAQTDLTEWWAFEMQKLIFLAWVSTARQGFRTASTPDIVSWEPASDREARTDSMFVPPGYDNPSALAPSAVLWLLPTFTAPSLPCSYDLPVTRHFSGVTEVPQAT